MDAKPARFSAIDAWRGLCALMVVIYHFRISSHVRELALVQNSWRFVDFFFVLSGFIITYSYRKKLVDYRAMRDFAYRRFLRLWPLHAAIVFALIAMETIRYIVTGQGFTGATSPMSIVPNLLLIHAWGLLPDTSWNGPSWSISAEVAAYISFAILFGLVRRHQLLLSAITAIGCAVIVATIAPHGMRSDHDFAVARCIFGFMSGVLLFHIWQRRSSPLPGATAWECISILLAIAAVGILPSGAAELLLVPIFTLIVYVFACSGGRISRALSAPPFQYLGERSYAIYMVHAPLWYGIFLLAGRLGYVSAHRGVSEIVVSPLVADVLTAAFIAATLLLAELAYRLIEQPGRRLARRRGSGLATGDGTRTAAPTTLSSRSKI